MLQKADLVTPAQELETQQNADVHQAAWTPAYVDLISTARGNRPLPGEGAVTPSNPNDTTAAALQGKTQMSFVQRGFYAQTTQIGLLPYRLNRSYLLIQNNDTVNEMYVAFGNAADATSALKLGPGAVYEPYKVPVDTVNILGSAANVLGMVIEGFEAPIGSHILPSQRMLNAPIAGVDTFPAPGHAHPAGLINAVQAVAHPPGRLMYYGYDMSYSQNPQYYGRGRKYAVSSVGGNIVRTWVD